MRIRKGCNVKDLLLSKAILLVAVSLVLCLWKGPADSTAAVDKTTRTQTNAKGQRQATFKKILSRAPLGNFQTSLEMKENVDFLLTPALLVQEVMSDDIVITYPSE